jgi:MFS family permease
MFSTGGFYGWRVAYALCVVATFTSGLIFYSLAVLLNAFISERGFPVGVSSLATGAFYIAAGIAGMIAGHLIARIDARVVMITSACAGGLALATIGLLREIWQLYAFYLVLGACYGGIGFVPASTIVARWFRARRPQALAVASTGMSLGGILITPLVAFVISRYGLAGAAPWLAVALVLGIVPVTAVVVRSSPQSLGLEPDGVAESSAAGAIVAGGVSYSEAVRGRFFAVTTIAFTLIFAAQLGAVTHIFRFVSLRTDERVAATALALMAAASLVGRFIGGWLLSYVSPRVFSILLMTTQAVALAMMAYADHAGPTLFAAALFGFGMGNIIMAQQLLTAEAFGTRDYSRIYATSQLIAVAGLAGGPPLAGLVSEATGYTGAYLVLAAVSLMGVAACALADQSHAKPADALA